MPHIVTLDGVGYHFQAVGEYSRDDTFDSSTFDGSEDSANSAVHYDMGWDQVKNIEWKDQSITEDEPGLPGVTIYSDLNDNGTLDTTTTTFDGDFI